MAERLSGTGVNTNALHPASLMDTKMVHEAFGHTKSTVEEGAEAVVRLAVSQEVEGLTGRYFDGKREAPGRMAKPTTRRPGRGCGSWARTSVARSSTPCHAGADTVRTLA